MRMEMICCNFWVEVAEKQVFFINLFPHPKASCRGGGANWVLEPYDWKDIEFLNYHVHQTGAPTPDDNFNKKLCEVTENLGFIC